MDETDIHYDVPIWAQRDSEGRGTRPRVPQQATPAHETAPPLVVPPPAAAPVPEVARTGEWTEVLPRRRVRGILLVAGLAGAVAGLVIAVTTQSPRAAVAALVCAVLAIVSRTDLITKTPTAVTLEGSVLTVRHDGRTDVFTLSDPNRRVETVGLPDQDGWRLRLEAPDLHVVELSASQVDPAVLHDVVRAYREVAAIKRREHEQRLRR
ncbi:MAG: hypothetical protein JWQ32_825 [Marmoricola sp.]|nr:hypothetical protein [Marmoricola sp.]